MRRLLALAIVGSVVISAAPSFAQDEEVPEAESLLDPWALDGHIMVDDDPGRVIRARGYKCAAIHTEVRLYNDVFFGTGAVPPDGGPTFISVSYGTLEDYEALTAWYSAGSPSGAETFPFSFGDFIFCTNVHRNGWLPATSEILASGNPWITIAIVGPTACDGGQFLMIRSIYWFHNGRWESEYGFGWAVDANGVVGGVAGAYELNCMEIVPGGDDDFADIVDRVPATQDNVNPTITGLTGLATWLWYDFTAPDSHLLVANISVTARGTTWNLDMTAWVDEVWWDIDCQTACDYHGTRASFDESGIDYVLDLPDERWQQADGYEGGEEGDGVAVFDYLYRTKRDYVVSTSTVWRGVYTFAGITYYYDPVVVSVDRPYQVVEIRSIITNP